MWLKMPISPRVIDQFKPPFGQKWIIPVSQGVAKGWLYIKTSII
jgi:hypothetical protein